MASNAAELSAISYARYGKTNVRVFRIVREGKWHHTVEYSVETLLEGDIETRSAFSMYIEISTYCGLQLYQG